MTFPRLLNVFLTLMYLAVSIFIFREPKKHNPYKNYRVGANLFLAFCFMLLIAPNNRPWIIPICVIGFLGIFVTMYLDRIDLDSSIARIHDSVETLKKKRNSKKQHRE